MCVRIVHPVDSHRRLIELVATKRPVKIPWEHMTLGKEILVTASAQVVIFALVMIECVDVDEESSRMVTDLAQLVPD